jgi:hypothetical protein
MSGSVQPIQQDNATETDEIRWLRKLMDIDGGVADVDPGLEKKQNLLEAARKEIEAHVDEIHVSESFVATMERSGVAGFLKTALTIEETMPAISKGGDTKQEFDTGHDTAQLEGMDPDDFNRLMKAQSVIAGEVAKLRKARHPVSKKKPLFTDREISEAIWAPLLRRKVIPENAIPDRYSEVAQTFAGASSEYEKRLAAYTDSLDRPGKAAERLGLGKDVSDALGVIGVSGVSGVVSGGVDLAAKNLTGVELNNIAKTAHLAISGLLDSARVVAIQPKRQAMGLETVNAILTNAINALATAGEAAFDIKGGSGKESRSDQSWGKALKGAIIAGLGLPSIGVQLAAGNPEKAIATLADGIANGAAAWDFRLDAEGKTDTKPMTVADWGMAGKDLLKGATSLGLFFKAWKSGKSTETELAKLLANCAREMGEFASTWAYNHSKPIEDEDSGSTGLPHIGWMEKVVKVTEEPLSHIKGNGADAELQTGKIHVSADAFVKDNIEIQQQDAIKSAVAAAWDAAPKRNAAQGAHSEKDIKKALAGDKILKTLSLVEGMEAADKAAMQEAAKEFEKELVDEQAAFREMLQASQSGAEDVETVEKLILVIKRDQMIIDLASKIQNATTQMIAALLPQANIVVAAVEAIKNFRRVIAHIQELRAWKADRANASAAMSVQVEAMLNRVDESGADIAIDLVKMVENAIKAVAAGFSTIGAFAPAGHVAAAGIATIMAAHDVLYKFYSARQLKKEWKAYEDALANPEDRKTVRAAIRKNPTLAKYVIAYGAREGNLVARSAVKRLGLTEKVLDRADANVQKVEAFLEALYPDDRVVEVPAQERKSWYPGSPALTAVSFMTFVGQAETALKPPLKKGICRPLMTAMLRREAAETALETARQMSMDADKAAADFPEGDTSQAATKAREAARSAMEARLAAAGHAARSTSTLAGALRVFKPITENGKDQGEMADYVRALVTPAVMAAAAHQREEDAVAAMLQDAEEAAA